MAHLELETHRGGRLAGKIKEQRGGGAALGQQVHFIPHASVSDLICVINMLMVNMVWGKWDRLQPGSSQPT